jgi:hypothetical protein
VAIGRHGQKLLALLLSCHGPFGVVAACGVPFNLITIPPARAMPMVGAVFFFFGLGRQVACSPKLEWFFNPLSVGSRLRAEAGALNQSKQHHTLPAE